MRDKISLKNKNLQIRLTNEFGGLSETTEKSSQKQSKCAILWNLKRSCLVKELGGAQVKATEGPVPTMPELGLLKEQSILTDQYIGIYTRLCKTECLYLLNS